MMITNGPSKSAHDTYGDLVGHLDEEKALIGSFRGLERAEALVVNVVEGVESN
jgi:hypothetical protein